ncbi:MAG: DUF3891 family protein [Pegethrix bostrychoides GSE-TBD4-15B]|uniref:DUF3891 family protein n=1 Tax=Pegethrix bostrychoides GSE-TBD4-15B TaxID=2839662 RepID=A0A951PA99_9CYAN|nr:DUF3891 family protein [Pegethrix bostrychoides GSE-TBD4-15B]
MSAPRFVLSSVLSFAWHFILSNAAFVRLYETIAAISHHDYLEKEWEDHNLTPAGAPLDFTLDSGVGDH